MGLWLWRTDENYPYIILKYPPYLFHLVMVDCLVLIISTFLGSPNFSYFPVFMQVCTQEEQEVLSRGSKKSEKLRQQLLMKAPLELLNSKCYNGDRDFLPNTSAKVREEYIKAEKHKEKLLEFDKTR